MSLSPAQQYQFLRQCGFNHSEAYSLVNRGVVPNLNTLIKRTGYERWIASKRNIIQNNPSKKE